MLVLFVAACAASTSTAAPHARAPAAAPQRALTQLEASRDLDNVVIGAARTPTVVMLLASWCEHCRAELAVFAALRAQHPHVRWLGLNYKAHEEYDGRGNSAAIRALGAATPWLRIVPADDALFTAFGSPPKVPTIFVYDRHGRLVKTFDRRDRPVPGESEVDGLLRELD